MDSFSLGLLLYLIIFKCHVRTEDESEPASPTSVETQYLYFDMSTYGPEGGVFASPNFPNYYPQDTLIFYRFQAYPEYRVEIEIDFFQIRGVTPQCTHDYLDVFINVNDFDSPQDTAHGHLLHRFCGRSKPPLLISFTNIIVLGFFTEDTQTERGFNGSFRFIPAKRYRMNLRDEPCDYLFDSSKSKRGELFSSTYPGTYLPWQFCNYSFVGQPNERIHIRFHDLMLYKTPNTQHCAVDVIKIYDQNLNSGELRRLLSSFRSSNISGNQRLAERVDPYHIADLCGTYSTPLDIYSATNQLLLYFIATHYAEPGADDKLIGDEKSTFFWRKGFYVEYEFLSSLTTLNFIPKSKSSQYTTGTECDQTIRSFGQGTGKIQSPNWPNLYKPQISCSTNFLGLDDRYALEFVEIEFDQFDIDCQLASLIIFNASRIYHHRSWLSTSASQLTDSSVNNIQRSASFSNFYQQELEFKDNLTFCGHFKPEGRFISQYARLKMSFIANDRSEKNSLPELNTGGKFQVKYRFVKSFHRAPADEYDTKDTAACNFSFFQHRSLTGIFELPRSSQNDYFSNTTCTFRFHTSDTDSRLLVWYDYFNVADNDNQCTSDHLAYKYRLNTSTRFQEHPILYCGYRNFPAPYLTLRSTDIFRIDFQSNDDGEESLGFDGRYQFINQSSSLINRSCRSPYDPIVQLNENDHPSGILSSNGYPENTICEWSYSTSNQFRFHLKINSLEIEGSKKRDAPQGCQSSVVRLLSEETVHEFCGKLEQPFDYFTKSNWFVVQFISFTRQTREQLGGFNMSWTRVKLKRSMELSQNRTDDNYFDCQTSTNASNQTAFLIPKILVCDDFVHCSPISDLDESSSICYRRQSIKLFSTLSKLSLFIQRHLNWILPLFVVTILMISGFLIVRRIISSSQQAENSIANEIRSRPKTSINDQDFSNPGLIEQAVTTV